MNGQTRNLWIIGAVLLLVVSLYLALGPLDLAGFSVPSTVAQIELTAEPSSTPLPSPTPTPAPTNTPTPIPTPTVGYLTVIAGPTGQPTTPARRASHNGGGPWKPEERAILIEQDAQEMYVYENGRKIKTIEVSTGKPILDHFTPTWTGNVGQLKGTFFSFGTYADDAWHLFRASGDILIHGAPYVIVNGQKVYQDLDALGSYPSSHGCIRIHPSDADWLTTWNIEGVPLIIKPWRGGFIE